MYSRPGISSTWTLEAIFFVSVSRCVSEPHRLVISKPPAKLWNKGPDPHPVCFGYGLNDETGVSTVGCDGMGRSSKRQWSVNAILEIILSDVEALRFWFNNYPGAGEVFPKLIDRFLHLRPVLKQWVESQTTKAATDKAC